MKRLWVVVIVGLGSFAALGAVVPGRGPLGIDREAFGAIDDVRGPSGDELARALTQLGSAYIAWPLALLGCVAVGVERRRRAAKGLLAGMVGAVIAVGVAKDLIGRPRPAGALVPTAGLSFPSGHATYATFWLGLALLLAVGHGRGRGRRALIVTGAAVMLLVGLTRVYLRAHYLSDVLAGWALASALLALGILAAGAYRPGRRPDPSE